MFAQFARWFKPSPEVDQANKLYISLVDQARQPVFYDDLGIPDSLDGRFEMILIHLFLLTHRLQDAGTPDMHELAQRVTEIFFNDMDRSLREIGVGDMSVGKKVKAMANAYNGRLTVYADTMADHAALCEALRRNAYGTATPDDTQVARLANYMHEAEHRLHAQSLPHITSGQMQWPASCSLPGENGGGETAG